MTNRFISQGRRIIFNKINFNNYRIIKIFLNRNLFLRERKKRRRKKAIFNSRKNRRANNQGSRHRRSFQIIIIPVKHSWRCVFPPPPPPPQLRQLRVLANLGLDSVSLQRVALSSPSAWLIGCSREDNDQQDSIRDSGNEVIDACAFKSFSNHGPRSASTI